MFKLLTVIYSILAVVFFFLIFSAIDTKDGNLISLCISIFVISITNIAIFSKLNTLSTDVSELKSKSNENVLENKKS